MSQVRWLRISGTTAADGSFTGTAVDKLTGNDAVVTGMVDAILFTPDGTVPPPDAFTFALTGESSGLSIDAETVADGDAAFTRYPRAATHDQAGAAALYAAAGTAVRDKVPLAGERIQLVIASGGNAKKFTFDIWVS